MRCNVCCVTCAVEDSRLTDIELSSAVGLGQHHISVTLQLAVEPLEEVFEQEGDQLPRQLETLVPVVVLNAERKNGMRDTGYGTQNTQYQMPVVFKVGRRRKSKGRPIYVEDKMALGTTRIIF